MNWGLARLILRMDVRPIREQELGGLQLPLTWCAI
jgi:hypothetical protein